MIDVATVKEDLQRATAGENATPTSSKVTMKATDRPVNAFSLAMSTRSTRPAPAHRQLVAEERV